LNSTGRQRSALPTLRPTLFTDAESAEDPIENIVGINSSGDFPKVLGDRPQLSGNEFLPLI
jgi:hypothetical protein